MVNDAWLSNPILEIPGNVGSIPARSTGDRAMKEKYTAVLEDREEKRIVKTEDGKEIEVKYKHYPNAVGPRSVFKGLPIWIGKTEASGCLDGEKKYYVDARCWTNEPFSYSQARVVSTGRLLKILKLPTSLAEQVRE